MTAPSISFEFFPPKTPEGAEKLRVARQQLYTLKPEFCSVTYGAGGSTQKGTFDTVQEILQEGMEAACHFSCVGATRDSVREELETLRQMGVKRLVALRGDLPSGHGLGGEFHHASDLVSFIRVETGDYFHIEVAGYPEIHPQARSPEADLRALKSKVDAGANGVITQYFFNADAYFRLVDEAATLGVSAPIVPGIMPITNSSQLIRFSMPAAPKCRDGSACACRALATIPPASRPLAMKSWPSCATSCCRAEPRRCTSTP